MNVNWVLRRRYRWWYNGYRRLYRWGIRHTKVIPYAGNVVTSDIAYALARRQATPKRLKFATVVRWVHRWKR